MFGHFTLYLKGLNNLRKKGTSLTLGENELLAERVRSYPCLCDKTYKKQKENNIVENAWKTVAGELDFMNDGKHSDFLVLLLFFLS